MKVLKIVSLILVFITIQSCKTEEKIVFIVKNDLNIERSFETVALTADFLKIKELSNIGIKDLTTGQLQITQYVDNDGNDVVDEVLFQPVIAAESENKYEIIFFTDDEKPKSPDYCYSRFVPERTDDYAWENNKVAFRVFGPDAQRRFENNLEEGTLSSGIDAWLKKVDYPIINKWYKKYTEKTGTYHEDIGEGLDNFHVGKSRGVGGIAYKKDSTYHFSENFTKWKTITKGPIRTSFYLEYDAWDAGGKQVKESRIISLDLGSNLSKFEINIDGVDTISAGLTLHEKDGEVTNNIENSWVSYWQPHDGSELGTAIVTPKKYLIAFETYNTEKVDLSNVYAKLKVIDHSIIYYSGYGWKESKQFNSKEVWENYLNDFSKKIQSPLKLKIIE